MADKFFKLQREAHARCDLKTQGLTVQMLQFIIDEIKLQKS